MLPKNEAIRRSRGGSIRGRAQALPTQVKVFEYSAATLEEFGIVERNQLETLRRSEMFKWIDVQGLKDIEQIRQIGEIFELHPLALEDVMKGGQRPKAEAYPGYMFYITHLTVMLKPGDVDDIQASIFIGPDFVITMLDRYGDVLEPVRDRMRRVGGRIRTSGVDYLAYAIIDVILDHYFPVLEELGEYFQDIEDLITENPDPTVIRELQQLRREVLCVRRSIWPQRDALNTLLRGEDQIFTANVRVYLRDCYDHCVQIIDVTETYRELVAGLFDFYHTSLSNRLNEVMKVLAIISTIFMPLSFLAGVYGMNFKYMPELDDPWGYWIWWLIVLLLGGLMYLFFQRKGWIGGTGRVSRRRTRAHSSSGKQLKELSPRARSGRVC